MYKNILLPIDLNHESSWIKALPVAVAHCEAFGSQLHIMTVIPDFGMSMVGDYFPEGFESKHREEVNKQLHAFIAKHVPDCNVQHIIAEGTAYKEILNTADEIEVDLIIMGSHRPELKDYLLGPNSERVVRHSNKSVLVVRD